MATGIGQPGAPYGAGYAHGTATYVTVGTEQYLPNSQTLASLLSGGFVSALTAAPGNELVLTAGSGNQDVNLVPTGTGYVQALVNSGGSASGLKVTQAGSGEVDFSFSRSGGTAASWLMYIPTAVTDLRFFNSNDRFVIKANGNIIIGGGSVDNSNGVLQLASSTSSTAGIAWGADTTLWRSAAGVLGFNGTGSVAKIVFSNATSSGDVQLSGADAYLTAATGQVVLRSNAVVGFTLDTSQNVTIVGNVTVKGGALALSTTSTLTDAASALTATLTNSPRTGNPLKWIQISDAGTTRYIPTW